MSCITCQQNDQADLLENPSKESFEKLLIRTHEKTEHKDSQVMCLVKRTVNHTAEKVISDNARCHKKCYVNFANRSKTERT